MTVTLPETPRYLRWEKAIRYYTLRLAPDLFGNGVLWRIWGRRNSALGQVHTRVCVSHAEGMRQFAQAESRRDQRGYVLIPSETLT